MKSKSIIRDILYGYFSVDNIKMSEAYDKLIDELTDADNKLTAELAANEHLTKLYQRYQKVYNDISLEETEIFFEAGVRFGILLGIETAGK